MIIFGWEWLIDKSNFFWYLWEEFNNMGDKMDDVQCDFKLKLFGNVLFIDFWRYLKGVEGMGKGLARRVAKVFRGEGER